MTHQSTRRRRASAEMSRRTSQWLVSSGSVNPGFTSMPRSHSKGFAWFQTPWEGWKSLLLILFSDCSSVMTETSMLKCDPKVWNPSEQKSVRTADPSVLRPCPCNSFVSHDSATPPKGNTSGQRLSAHQMHCKGGQCSCPALQFHRDHLRSKGKKEAIV